MAGRRNHSPEKLTENFDERIYSNTGNTDLLSFLDSESRSILDVGCGAGDNAALIRRSRPEAKIHGLTLSAAEKERALQYMDACWVGNVEGEVPEAVKERTYDTLLFSHVLEHLREPARTLASLVGLLRPAGSVLIAVPNTLIYHQRLKFLAGKFKYKKMGIMDSTHLRFFTYYTADKYLTHPIDCLETEIKTVSGHLPLGPLRRYVLPTSVSEYLDSAAIGTFPNVFGNQVILRARKEQQ